MSAITSTSAISAFAGIVFAIDPGTTQSAWLRFDCAPTNALARIRWPVLNFAIEPNDVVLDRINSDHYDALAIEMIASYGMAVGAEVFETCLAIGAMLDRAQVRLGEKNLVKRYTRLQVKLHHCASPRANDGNVRQALIDRFGGRIRAIGTTKSPGPLHGVHNDVWSALAIGQKFADDHAGIPF